MTPAEEPPVIRAARLQGPQPAVVTPAEELERVLADSMSRHVNLGYHEERAAAVRADLRAHFAKEEVRERADMAGAQAIDYGNRPIPAVLAALGLGDET